ncbi:hypothetical protein [Trueperella pyogenes]|uniref:Gram-positive cocci surface proteins LPxTG domain-containing protein n=1 Tax=Trueperella pyogenes TaxID=1661 RepID=A0ABV3NDL6_9ACTO
MKLPGSIALKAALAITLSGFMGASPAFAAEMPSASAASVTAQPSVRAANKAYEDALQKANMLKARLDIAQEEVNSMKKLLETTRREQEEHDRVIQKQFENRDGNHDNEKTVRLAERFKEQQKQLESRTKDLEKARKAYNDAIEDVKKAEETLRRLIGKDDPKPKPDLDEPGKPDKKPEAPKPAPAPSQPETPSKPETPKPGNPDHKPSDKPAVPQKPADKPGVVKPLLSRIITGPSVEMEDKTAAEAPSATIPSAKAPAAKADVLNPAGKNSKSAKKMAASKQKALAYTGASTDGAVAVSVLTILTGAAAFLASRLVVRRRDS